MGPLLGARISHCVCTAVGYHGIIVVVIMSPPDLLKKDRSHVTLQWVLSLLEQRIRHHDNASEHTLFLVDLLPNLQTMVTHSNINKDISKHLSQFEEQLPIAFALYLSLSEVSMI